MALPTMSMSCLQCQTSLEKAEQFCPKCGADRELELAIAIETKASISSLRRLLLVVGVLSLLSAGGLYLLLQNPVYGGTLTITSCVFPVFAMGVAMLGLRAFAHKAPLPVSIMATALFASSMGSQILLDPQAALTPNLTFFLRVLIAIVLIRALLAALRSKKMRDDAAAKRPTARVVKR